MKETELLLHQSVRRRCVANLTTDQRHIELQHLRGREPHVGVETLVDRRIHQLIVQRFEATIVPLHHIGNIDDGVEHPQIAQMNPCRYRDGGACIILTILIDGVAATIIDKNDVSPPLTIIRGETYIGQLRASDPESGRGVNASKRNTVCHI